MRKTLLAVSLFGIAVLIAPETLAVCVPYRAMVHQVSHFACADSTEVSALAYQITDPLVSHTGTEDIACEEDGVAGCFGSRSGTLGDKLVTIQTSWSESGIAGCPIKETGEERVLIVVQGSDGKGVLVSIGRGTVELTGSYLVDMAHPYDATTQEFLPLDCHDRTGRPRVIAQSANPGNTFTLVLHFEPPLVQSDCDPGSAGVAFGTCLDGFQPNSAVGGVYTSVQPCGAPSDLRLASWTNTGVQPDANGDATITVTQPTDGRCLLIGGTSIIGGFESGAITGFLTFGASGCRDADGDGFTDCAGDCDDANAAIHPGATEICNAIDDNCDGAVDEGVCDQSATDIFIDVAHGHGENSATVTWRTINEVDVRGFNVVEISNQGSRFQQNSALIGCDECGTGRGSSYSFFFQKPRSGRNIFVEVVHQDGTVQTFGPAIKQ